MISGKKTEKEKNIKLTNQSNNKNSNLYNFAKKVIVIGGANIDIKGRSFSQLGKITSNPGVVNITLGGVGRNIAHNLALLKVPVIFLSVIGDDEWGRKILKETGGAGVDMRNVKISSRNPTGIYIAILNEMGEMVVAVSDMKVSEEINVKYLKSKLDFIRKSQMIVIETNLPEESIKYVSKICAEEGIKLIVDPVSVKKSKKLKKVLNNIDYMTPNKEELESLLGGIKLQNDEDIIREVQSLRNRSNGIKNIVLTLGKRGVFLSGKEAGVKQNAQKRKIIDQFIPSYKVEAVEVTGIGDALVAGLVYGIYSNYSLDVATKYGLAAAALTVSTPYTVCPGMKSELLRILVEK